MRLSSSADYAWSAVDSKLQNARAALAEMAKTFEPVPVPQQHAAILSTGALVGRFRQEDFLAHFDAFLAGARSIPDIIQSAFGHDSVQKKWLQQLTLGEQQRRSAFQTEFQSLYAAFGRLPLSRIRVDTVHRRGAPSVEMVKGTQRYPLHSTRPPDAVSEHIIAGKDPALQFAAALPPQPVRHSRDEFFIVARNGRRRPLFLECEQYLNEAQKLVTRAHVLYDRFHRGQALRRPPRK